MRCSYPPLLNRSPPTNFSFFPTSVGYFLRGVGGLVSFLKGLRENKDEQRRAILTQSSVD